MKPKSKLKSISKLKKDVWKLFSLWIRLKDADWRGNNVCVTCHKTYPYKKLQAGHFIPGRHNAVLFNEDLVHPQCYSCNFFLGGNPREYDKFMRQKYGDERVEEFDLLGKGKKNGHKEYTIQDLEELKKVYTEKLTEFQSKMS